jgi:hypothetical protein
MFLKLIRTWIFIQISIENFWNYIKITGSVSVPPVPVFNKALMDDPFLKMGFAEVPDEVPYQT